jgi:hypothetical protein
MRADTAVYLLRPAAITVPAQDSYGVREVVVNDPSHEFLVSSLLLTLIQFHAVLVPVILSIVNRQELWYCLPAACAFPAVVVKDLLPESLTVFLHVVLHVLVVAHFPPILHLSSDFQISICYSYSFSCLSSACAEGRFHLLILHSR